MNDGTLIDMINLTFIARTRTAIHYCLSAWKTGKCRVQPEFGPGGGAQPKCDIRNINHTVNNVSTDVFRGLDVDSGSSLTHVQTKKIENICSMVAERFT